MIKLKYLVFSFCIIIIS